ncbi:MULTISPECIES: hypothetical protein [unclassified Maridesulfovibrio]|uniref:hypothetical protein n=1 Tax=unclassified Maridesulfovibrio TaxID=2794999 RepID=UPI003B3C6FEF
MSILPYIKDIACYNQGELVQYAYLASRYHMQLKDCLREDSALDERAETALCNLESYLNDRFEKICHRNFQYIEGFFEEENRAIPRVCLKATYEDSIVCLFRSTSVEYNLSYPSTSNSGFQFIQKTGQYFFCNNIPEAAQLGYYRNPRLNLDKVSNYKPNLFANLLFKNTNFDTKWVECWDAAGDGIDPQDCYKSTLIVPLTLWNNTLSDEFVGAIQQEKGRKIYGYLCLDYTEVNFFGAADVFFLYIMADLLSLFVITRRNYTVDSNTYRKVRKSIF